MKNGLRVVVFFALIFSMSFLNGCEDPVASMVKSTQDAAVEHHKIEAEKEMKEMEIELERERIRQEAMERQAERNHELNQIRAGQNPDGTGTTVPNQNAEDTKTDSIDQDTDDTLTNPGQ